MNNKNLIKSFIPALMLILAASILAPAAHAATMFQQMSSGFQNMVNAAYGGGTAVAVDQNTFLNSLITIINVLLTFVGVVFFLLLIYAGFLWMTARGNEEQVKKAKELMKQIIIGLIIIISSRLVTELILSIVSKSIVVS